jgi:hypothetical protein
VPLLIGVLAWATACLVVAWLRLRGAAAPEGARPLRDLAGSAALLAVAVCLFALAGPRNALPYLATAAAGGHRRPAAAAGHQAGPGRGCRSRDLRGGARLVLLVWR